MTATPRPWTIKKIVNVERPTTDVWIYDANGVPLMITGPEKAALIVRAVNSHDQLVEALEFYTDPVRYRGPNQRRPDGDRFTPEDAPFIHDATKDGGEIARAALKAAKGEA